MRELTNFCRGCGACYLICTHGAIQIKENNMGFFQAYINEEMCTSCGACKLICEQSKKGMFELKDAEHYVGVSKNKVILNKSSSGGIGYVFAKSIICHGGISCGVIYNYEHDRAEHILCKNINDAQKTQGSKYLQSYCIHGFDLALKQKEKTIVFGTPCQIAGFRNIINYKKLDNFLLVDIFCHGVPSTKIWRNHINSIRKNYNTKRNDSIITFPNRRTIEKPRSHADR